MPDPSVISENLREIGRVLRPQGIAYIHLMTERGSFKKFVKKRLKQLVPNGLWQRLGFAALTFDKTWVGTSLNPKQIDA